jgi:transcriptional repressor NrdR
MPKLVKRDDRREPFDEEKLRAGITRALEKRPVSAEKIEAAVGRITHRLRTAGEREVPSRQVGEMVMEELHQLDAVAYVRFASVYRSFQDVEEFRDEVERLRAAAAAAGDSDQIPLLPGDE